MGVYDEYGKNGTQLKISNDGVLALRCYNIGDTVPLNDGIYVSSEIIVVIDGKLVAVFDRLIDKWGETIDISCLLQRRNPVAQALAALVLEMEREEEEDA